MTTNPHDARNARRQARQANLDRLARLALDCESHKMQARLTDPLSGASRWACEGCGADCGPA